MPLLQRLDEGWEVARAGSDEWVPASVPGTVASAMAAAGRWRPGEPDDFDDHDWVFRVRFDAPAGPAPARLRLGGVATVADVVLNGAAVARGESMFVPLEADVTGALRERDNELTITCRALAPLLAAPRRPRARWRTRLVDNALRWHRTMLLGRAPGFAASPAAVGPWRPVWLDRRAPAPAARLRTRLDGDAGIVEVRTDGPVEVEAGGHLALVDGEGTLTLPDVERWWPHTAGDPVLHDVRVGEEVRRVGFRSLEAAEPFGLVVNGSELFARGAVWTPLDPVGLAPSPAALRAALEQVRDAGMNILRVVGTGAYETPLFHDLCDELGILVWQDFMFANLDYPAEDEAFGLAVRDEARALLAEVGHRPSTAVLCGNSEVEQQVAMLGLDPALGRGPLFGEQLPQLVREEAVAVPYVPSAPCGPGRPFRPDQGIAHWFGVGGYRRGLGETRAAGVRFAAECLAFSNLGDADALGGAGVPSDNGAEWDFADVRDHYVGELYGVDPAALAPERYLALGRQATGEAMAEVLGEWRRPGSLCRGAIVLWLHDREPGAGWGLVDSDGRPKAALAHVRRACAPLAVWTTDEGQSGIAAHVANDGPASLVATLRVALYADGERCVGEAAEGIRVPPRTVITRDVEELLGRFADVSWSYRFGPPAQDTVVAALEREDGTPLAKAFRFPVGRPVALETAGQLGLAVSRSGERVELVARRVVHGVRVRSAAGRPSEDAFTLEPGRPQVVSVPGLTAGHALRVTAINLAGDVAA